MGCREFGLVSLFFLVGCVYVVRLGRSLLCFRFLGWDRLEGDVGGRVRWVIVFSFVFFNDR